MNRAPMLAAATLAALALQAAVEVAPSLGAGATYQVLKCHVFSRSASEIEGIARGAYSTSNRCASDDQRLEIENHGYAIPGQSGTLQIAAPPGTAIVGVDVRANLRRDNHHWAQLAVVTGSGTSVLAQGTDTGQGFQRYVFSGLDASTFAAQLFCSDPGGCPASDQAHAFIQDLNLKLADRSDPVVTRFGGRLLSGGWIRGVAEFQAEANDFGSGIQQVTASVNGSEIARAPIGCGGIISGGFSSVLSPCPLSPDGGFVFGEPNTALPPFSSGRNSMTVCARDFAGNQPACSRATVYVDNAAPRLAFRGAQDRDDPELIRATAVEPDSGIQTAQISYRPVGGSLWTALDTERAEGELRARIDSQAVPAGEYEFRATATDVAGNAAETLLREDGRPMVLRLPLRESVDLSGGVGPGQSTAQTVRYKTDSRASGRLVDSNGAPLTGQPVTVEEYFGTGALIDRRLRTVVTDERGKWSSKLPAGPSRTVTASFPGTHRYGPSAGQIGTLDVKSRASFRTSRAQVPEGERVVFSGRVGHLGARMPSSGKLIELQVEDGPGSWNTVRQAFHTSASGRYELTYRFGRFYDSDAEFRFRVKVAEEQGWPYEAPTRSRARTVTVLSR